MISLGLFFPSVLFIHLPPFFFTLLQIESDNLPASFFYLVFPNPVTAVLTPSAVFEVFPLVLATYSGMMLNSALFVCAVERKGI